MKQLPKPVPLRPSSFDITPIPNPSAHLSASTNPRKFSLSTPESNTVGRNVEITENDIEDNNKIPTKGHFIPTPSIIGSNYSNNSSNRSSTNKSSGGSGRDLQAVQPFNPNTLRPPSMCITVYWIYSFCARIQSIHSLTITVLVSSICFCEITKLHIFEIPICAKSSNIH